MPFTKYMKTLRDKNMKVTQQRLEILKYLDENRTHPTLDNLYEFIRSKFPSVSKMTVYNVISSLVENGIINPLRFVNSTELRVDFEKSGHLHFMCNVCGKIFDIKSKIKFDELLESKEHRFENYDVNIYGTCKNCLKK